MHVTALGCMEHGTWAQNGCLAEGLEGAQPHRGAGGGAAWDAVGAGRVDGRAVVKILPIQAVRQLIHVRLAHQARPRRQQRLRTRHAIHPLSWHASLKGQTSLAQHQEFCIVHEGARDNARQTMPP